MRQAKCQDLKMTCHSIRSTEVLLYFVTRLLSTTIALLHLKKVREGGSEWIQLWEKYGTELISKLVRDCGSPSMEDFTMELHISLIERDKRCLGRDGKSLNFPSPLCRTVKDLNVSGSAPTNPSETLEST